MGNNPPMPRGSRRAHAEHAPAHFAAQVSESRGIKNMVDALTREVWDRMKRRMLDQVDGGRGDWTYPDDVFETILAGEPTREVVE